MDNDDEPIDEKPSDPNGYVLISGVRSGLKREFAFVLKAQAEISASVGRTRSCKSPSIGKKPKISDDDELPEIPPCSAESVATAPAPIESKGEIEEMAVEEASIMIEGEEARELEVSVVKKPTIRFTRPAKTYFTEGPAAETPLTIEIGDESLAETPSPLSKLVGSAAETPIVVEDNDGPIVETPIGGGNRSEVDSASLEKLMRIFARVDDGKGLNMDAGVAENPAKRFTRSALKVPPIEQECSMEEDSIMVDNFDGCKEGINDAATNKTELKISKKIALTKIPSRVRDLLATGLLDGYPVKYRTNDKHAGLEGIIRGNNILCFCATCKGSKMILAYNFELHAGSTKKHPSDFIYLENGNSLHDVIKACTDVSLDMLGCAIQNAIGTEPPKKTSICQECRETFHTSCTGSGKVALLCDSCIEKMKAQATTSPSSWSSSNAKSSKIASVPGSSDIISKNTSSHRKSYGKLTKKHIGLNRLVFEGDILLNGTELGYYAGGKKLLDGYIKYQGIFCKCCENVISASSFEAHAGRASRKKPYNNIYTSNGVSLHELAVSLAQGRNFSISENDDLCSICSDGGELLLCDGCPRSFHKECVGLSSIPKGKWYCQYCQNMQQRKKSVEYNSNAIAAGRVAGIDPIEQIIKRCIRIVTTPGTDVGGCVFCRQHDFTKSGFDQRTVLLCDQCEKEYHVGCLKAHNMGDLKELPEEEWFCCTDCSKIHAALQKLLIRGSKPLQDLEVNIIKKKRWEKVENKNAAVDVRWRLLSGKSASADSKLLLSKAVSMFHESFDPIVEAKTDRDLIPFMVYGQNMRDQDFRGMYCAVLTENSSVVSAGILRVLGSEVAELPLVATSRESQGKGYFQSLFSCIERLLGSLKVKHFVLPAADEALSIWTKKFGFSKIDNHLLNEYTKGARPMIFEGTSMLHKPVPRARVSPRR